MGSGKLPTLAASLAAADHLRTAGSALCAGLLSRRVCANHANFVGIPAQCGCASGAAD